MEKSPILQDANRQTSHYLHSNGFSLHSIKIPTVAGAAPINVELPKFDGDPLQWRKFHTMFTAAITTRAVEFSELDKKCLLSNSILPKDGKDIMDREGGPQPAPRATKEKIWTATSCCSPSDQEDGPATVLQHRLFELIPAHPHSNISRIQCLGALHGRFPLVLSPIPNHYVSDSCG